MTLAAVAEQRPAIDKLFHLMCQAKASDLHLSVGTAPLVRKDGRMQLLDPAMPVFTDEFLGRLLDPIMPAANKHEFAERHDTDFAYEIAKLARFRCNVLPIARGEARSFG